MKVLIAYSIGVLLTGHINEPEYQLNVVSFAHSINASAKRNKIVGTETVVTPEDIEEVIETLVGLGLMENR